MVMPNLPRPIGAWSLVFRDGSLASVKTKWHITCPLTWANKLADGTVENYALLKADERKREAMFELIQPPVSESTMAEITLPVTEEARREAWPNPPFTLPARLEDGDVD
jgi:hypothetical protein